MDYKKIKILGYVVSYVLAVVVYGMWWYSLTVIAFDLQMMYNGVHRYIPNTFRYPLLFKYYVWHPTVVGVLMLFVLSWIMFQKSEKFYKAFFVLSFLTLLWSAFWLWGLIDTFDHVIDASKTPLVL